MYEENIAFSCTEIVVVVVEKSCVSVMQRL